MQGIGRIAGARGPGAARGTSRQSHGFEVPVEAGATSTETSAAAGVAAPSLGLLSLQESGAATGRNAAAWLRAADILDELQGLQGDLLAGGTGDPDRLARLAALDSGEEGADAVLQALVEAVVLRAKIELARRNHAGATTLS